MSYRPGIGWGLRKIGLEPCDPHFRCDYVGCEATFVVRGRGMGSVPPSWFLNGKAPPHWKKMGGGDDRRDYCPQHAPAKKENNEL